MPTLARIGGVRGLGVLATPGKRYGAPFSSLSPTVSGKPFRSQPFSQNAHTRITGITKDSAGVALPACTVDLFSTPQDLFVATTVSDGSGNYAFENPGSPPFYIVAYKVGAPDVAGTTVNTLAAA